VTFDFFSGISIEVSGVDVGFVATLNPKKFLEFTFVRKNIHASQVDCIIVEW